MTDQAELERWADGFEALHEALHAKEPPKIETSGSGRIFGAMIDILAAMPAIGKDQENRDQGFKFRGVDDILAFLKPLLAEHRVFYVPTVLEREPAIRTTRNGGSLYVTSLHIAFTFYADDGSWIRATVWGEGADSGDKSTPKAHTGAQKSALSAIFSIATRDTDPDAESQEESNPYVPPPDGWSSMEEHDAWRHTVRERGAALPLDLQGEFAKWWTSTGWKWPLTGEQADIYSEHLAGVEALHAAALEGSGPATDRDGSVDAGPGGE